MASGTGFFYLPPESKTLYLVTNYHIATGSDPRAPNVLLPGFSGQPDEIRYRLLSSPKLELVTGSVQLSGNAPIEHPRRDEGVDIAALPVRPPNKGLFLTQTSLQLEDDIEISVGGDLFIIGFPFGFGAGNFLPIWKRGTIASEPNFHPNDLAMFYIDASTKPGMSGSPVFAAESRTFYNLEGDATEAIEEWERGDREPLDVIKQLKDDMGEEVQRRMLRLVGIYSGRITISGSEDPQIGIVWRKELLDEMLIGN